MSETISIILPDNYTVKQYYIRGTADQIREQVINRKFRHILGAIEFPDGNAALYYKCAVCPHCGKKNLLRTVPPRDGYPSRESMENWATGQNSFFGDYQKSSFIMAQDVILPEVLTCKKCGKTSERGDCERSVLISSHRGKINISIPFDNMFEFLKDADYSVMTLTAPFIYTQEITFNLHNGHTSFGIRNHQGESVYVRDITTCDDEMFLESDLPEIICLPSVREAVRKKFEEYGSLSFEDKELDFRTFILATRFVGYPHDFYRKIPFELGTKKIYPELRRAAKQIRIAKNLPKVYERVGLPKCKSIRRAIFTDPAIMFYFRELKKLCDIVGNVDMISISLSQNRMYALLARLTAYPEVFRYISDCVESGRMRKVARMLLAPLCTMEKYINDGICYAVMSRSARRRILEQPTCNENEDSLIIRQFLPSHPIHKPYPDLSVGKYAGYDFEWLITTEDYRHAGKSMSNCLADYDDPVMVMKKDGEYIAAFSLISEDVIGQAYLRENINMGSDEKTLNALGRWAKKNGVTFRIPTYDEFENIFGEEYA